MKLKKIGFRFNENDLLTVKGKKAVDAFIRFINPHKIPNMGITYDLILNGKTMPFKQGIEDFHISKKAYRQLLYRIGQLRVKNKKKIVFKI